MDPYWCSSMKFQNVLKRLSFWKLTYNVKVKFFQGWNLQPELAVWKVHEFTFKSLIFKLIFPNFRKRMLNGFSSYRTCSHRKVNYGLWKISQPLRRLRHLNECMIKWSQLHLRHLKPVMTWHCSEVSWRHRTQFSIHK